MLKNKILEKLLAIILIFTLTFANFAFVTEAYASSLAETIFGFKSGTGHENIGFEAYFGAEENTNSSVISDVNNQELAIGMKLNVRESGYLKDAKIAIVETEEGKGLNFKLKGQEQLPEYVQSIEDNVLTLQQINNSEEDVKILVPIEYKNESYVNEEKLSKDLTVIFSGIYVDNEGEEINVSRDILLTLSWKDERNVNVETAVEKYIDFGSGIILQTKVKVDTATENNTLPIKESEVTITAPSIDGKYPTSAYVVANSTMGTNGQNVGEVNFTEENWNYNIEDNKVTIKVNNEKQLVRVNEFENEYLQEADQEIIEEERYYNGSSADEYLVTYTFMDTEVTEEPVSVNSDIEAKVTTLSGVLEEQNINIVTNNNNYEYLLEGKIGEIVSLNIENKTSEVSKAYTYVNYNNNGKYEVELETETLVNVSYSNLLESLRIDDLENTYTSKDGNVVENNDVYYKQISIQKDNLVQILGEEGEIKVIDLSGTTVATINNQSEVNEEGKIVVGFADRHTRLSFETTKPIAEGNLVIDNVKVMNGASVDKTTYANIESMNSKASIKARFANVAEILEVGTAEAVTTLKETTTKATLAMDRDSLSTLEMNENVELRIELNNATDLSDVYGHSVFEVDIPESIEILNITNSSVLYGEGLDITSVEIVDRKIIVTVDGKQDGINSGVLTNGTNIVLNADIKVNLYTPAKTEVMTLRYNNQEATNYENEGVTEFAVNYSAPTGLVAVNSTSNYNNLGTTLTSVRQGDKLDILDIYVEAKAATMEIVVMNNNENTVSNFSILGRIPFAGVKDILTGEELGTTKDTKLLGALVSDERNAAEFTVYYSENGEATKDLNNPENGWVELPESFDNIKSYLIVPVDANYEMQEAEILRFTYQYEIPGLLAHNERFFGTFLAYYTNNSDIAITDDETAPDKIGLTTGEGPELSLAASVDKESVRENEEIQMTLTVTNTGESKAEDVNVEFIVPDYTTLISTECDKENVHINTENNIMTIHVDELEKEGKFEVKVNLKINPSGSGKTVKGVASLKAKDLGTVITAETNEVEVVDAELLVSLYNDLDIETEAAVYDVGAEVILKGYVHNVTGTPVKNAVVTMQLPNELTYVSSAILSSLNTRKPKIVGEGTFDESTRTVTWTFEEIDKNAQISLTVKTSDLPENTTYAKAETQIKAKAEGTQEYESGIIVVRVGKPILTITQTTNNMDTYIKEGDRIDYVFTVKNDGKAVAKHVNLKEVIPDGILVEKVNYVVNGIPVTKRVNSNKDVTISASIQPGSEMLVTVKAVATNLNGVQEKTVTNYALLEADNVEELQSNSITHIVEQSEKNNISYDESSGGLVVNNGSSTVPTQNNITKTYRISGTAWLDSNENGMKEDGEQLMTGVSVKLVNSVSGLIIKSAITDSRGNYTFAGVENGNYLIIFDYDTVKYTVTAYRKDGVEDSVNSDAVTTKLEQGGKFRNGAVTDVISIANGSVSGVNIGFVLADTFDLKLDKTITKMTVQTAKGTTTDTFENAVLAKTEIAAKYVSGSTVYVEYEFKVSNVGDVAGYAKKIIDYLPEGMTFNSSLEANKSWYTGADGNIYTTALENKELAPGETATVKVVLTKQMTDDNVGIVNNLAEIYDDYNIYGISDTNSTPANKAQGENDLGSADAVILVKTGEVFIHISVIITSMLLGSIVAFIVLNKIKIVKSRRKGGV